MGAQGRVGRGGRERRIGGMGRDGRMRRHHGGRPVVLWGRVPVVHGVRPHARRRRGSLQELRGVVAEDKVLRGLRPVQGVLPGGARLMQLLRVSVSERVLWGWAVKG